MRKTLISWTDYSWNPWQGCRKVSAGCKNCYMYRDKARYGQDPAKVVLSSHQTFIKPLNIKEDSRIFTCSWSDFFIEDADLFRQDAWAIIEATSKHTYQILTKRIENVVDRLPVNWGSGWDNVWLGTSIENQKAADERIPLLLQVPAKVRFLSIEPMLESIAMWLDAIPQGYKIDWLIVGCESGTNRRECKTEWIESIVGQCKAAGIPVFVKQIEINGKVETDVNKFPEHLRIQEFPK